MKLIVEELEEKVEYITEAKDGKEKFYIHGKFLQANQKNKNGRVYPVHVMEGAVEKYKNDILNNNRAYGELGHPPTPQINLDRVSHLIKELTKDGDSYVGKALLTETPMGNIAIGLLKSGANLGVSSRGLGSLKPTNEGVMEVQPDFRLATAADIVADPSGPGCYVQGIMENVDWVFDERNGWQALELAENHKKHIHENYKRLDEEAAFKMFDKFLKSISK